MNKKLHTEWEKTSSAGLWRQELREMARLAWPLTLNKLAFMTIIATDTLMMGWLGPKALAAGSLAGHFFGFVILFSIGLLSVTAPIFAQHLGANRFKMIRRTFRQGAWIACIIAVPSMLLIWQTGDILLLLGQDEELALMGQSYVRWMIIGFLPSQLRVVFSFLLASHNRPRVNLLVTLIGIGLNITANYALMFGHFGFPKLGLDGAGISSAFVMTSLFLITLTYVLLDRNFGKYRLLENFWRTDWSQFKEIFRVGFPIAITEMSEISLFFAAILFVGLLGTDAVSAHAIAIQSCAIMVMVAVGVSQAATVRVGYAIGAGNRVAAFRSCWTAFILGTTISFVPAFIFWVFGSFIVGIYLDTSASNTFETASLAISFLAIGALFQIVDYIQVVSRGILQGVKDTRWPMFVAMGSYWGIGIPMMAVFSIYLNYSGQYIWISLVIALSVIALLLVYRLRQQFRRLRISA